MASQSNPMSEARRFRFRGAALIGLCTAFLAGTALAQPLDTWYRDSHLEVPGCAGSAVPYLTGGVAAEVHALQVADYNARCAAVECYRYAVAKVHRPSGVGEASGSSVGEYLGTNRYSNAACTARPPTVVSLLPAVISCSSGNVLGASGACEAEAGPDHNALVALWGTVSALLIVALVVMREAVLRLRAWLAGRR
jgi:hypothetical protein